MSTWKSLSITSFAPSKLGCLLVSGITGSISHENQRQDHPRQRKTLNLGLHAQVVTLAAQAGAAVVEYYDHRTLAKKKPDPYSNFLQFENKN
ncbi:hypothetical protein V2J09_016128 [Rumex salicifolius]